MSPLLSAVFVRLPPASRLLKSLKWRPYTCSSPSLHVIRGTHSGGPPSTSCEATGARSEILRRLYLSAVSLVTPVESPSAASDGLTTVICLGAKSARSFGELPAKSSPGFGDDGLSTASALPMY